MGRKRRRISYSMTLRNKPFRVIKGFALGKLERLSVSLALDWLIIELPAKHSCGKKNLKKNKNKKVCVKKKKYVTGIYA